jgi:hypothetical protein
MRWALGGCLVPDRILTGRWVGEAQDNAPVACEVTYPYLVVRLMPAVYLRGRIQIGVGPPAVEVVGMGTAGIQSPQSPLLRSTSNAVRGRRYGEPGLSGADNSWRARRPS